MRDFDPQEFMQLSVKLMRDSVAEPRLDGKICPFVGAVLWRPDGSTQTAFRGELRDGDHAEYTLLERKNLGNRLDGSVLFSTLEPCAPEARNPPKISCARRIVLARIKQVWVGIEDPDPTVDRKGIKYLQDNGVDVQMFDADLQKEIRQVNQKYIDQALERQSQVDEDSHVGPLTELDNPIQLVSTADFSQDALVQYRMDAGVDAAAGSAEFSRRLARQGLLVEANGLFVPTGSGLLLFGSEPRLSMSQAGLMATINYADGTEEVKDFDGPLVLVPRLVEKWLKGKLPNPVSRAGARRREVNDVFFTMVREAITNALLHRDYSVEGARCHLTVEPDFFVVKSPGEPVEPIDIAQLQSFVAPTLSRNPALHFVFSQMELAEERGLGMKSMKDGAQIADLPLPVYSWDKPYLVLKLFRTRSAATASLSEAVLGSLKEDDRASWEYISGLQSVTTRALMDQMGFNEKKAQRVLRKLIDTGLLRRQGAGKNTTYEVVRS